MNEHEYLTQEKFKEFTIELAELKNVKRKEVAENLEYAKSLGDLAENAEYHDARDVQATVEDRIMKLEHLLKHAKIVAVSSGGAVNIGSTVTVDKDGKRTDFIIVGSEESNVAEGKISMKSPFGQAILGKKKGDKFTFSAPSGEVSYFIAEVK